MSSPRSAEEGLLIGPHDLSARERDWLLAAGLPLTHLYTAADIARLFGVKQRTIYQWIDFGWLGVCRIRPHPSREHLRIPLGEVMRLLRAHDVTPHTSTPSSSARVVSHLRAILGTAAD
jgi:hypothetical protein